MKKHYQKLSMTVVYLDTQLHILSGSDSVSSVVGELEYGGGGSGVARGRGRGSDEWDDEETDF